MTVTCNWCSYLILCVLVINYIDISSSHDCQLWHFYSKTNGMCECCTNFKCTANYVYVGLGYCLTWNNATYDVEISRCRFTHQDPNLCAKYEMYSISTEITGQELSDVTCKIYNRQGTQCRRCIDGYGPAAFSDGVTCADCSKHKYMWILNLLFQLTMVTLMYLTVILLQIKGTSSPFNVITTYGQLVIIAVMVSSGLHAKVICFTNNKFTVSFLTLVGVLNLDFFRFIIPPLCISASMKSITVLLFDYVIAVYPIVLTVFIYVSIELHDSNCWIIVSLSSPLKRFWHRNWNPKETILITCATFLLLSYSKFLHVSLSLLFTVHTYNCSGEVVPNSTVLLYDPTIRFFHSEHIPYVVLALSVIVIFVLLPPLLLLLYPTRLFRKCLSCCGFRRWDIFQLVMDIFQGWYKDGTDGTLDYRPLSSLYMFLRFVIACAYFVVISMSNKFIYIFELVVISLGMLHVFLGMVFLVAKPYKVKWMSHTDGLLLILFGVFVLTYVFHNRIIYLVGIALGLAVISLSCLYTVYKCLV